jgi:hypothetical protein
VFYCVLKFLCYNLADMHKLTRNIPEVMTFSTWLSVNQTTKSGLNSMLYSHIWTFEINTFLALNFM